VIAREPDAVTRAFAGRSWWLPAVLPPAPGTQQPASPAPAASPNSRNSPAAPRSTRRARGEGTRRAYRSAWRQYDAWCRSLGREPLAADPDTIAMYVVRCADAGFAVSSIRVHLAAIRTAHLLAGLSLDLRHPRRQTAPAVLRLMLA
jgi:hypothetical protein